ncbi:MAG: zinc ribbon domain-containing protein [Deltaproteobacteria bacterium]|nr:zinc ribbon domain-containing protein [Deltaproteobacteria bacterium]
MPIYEYKCRKCGKNFEVFQKITDDEVKSCRFCGDGRVEKLISLSAFHLKGSGWYVTDYGGKKPSATENTGSEKDTTSTTESSGASDVKAKEKE